MLFRGLQDDFSYSNLVIVGKRVGMRCFLSRQGVGLRNGNWKATLAYLYCHSLVCENILYLTFSSRSRLFGPNNHHKT